MVFDGLRFHEINMIRWETTVLESGGKIQNWFVKSFWYRLLWFAQEWKRNQVGSSILTNFYGWTFDKQNLDKLS